MDEQSTGIIVPSTTGSKLMSNLNMCNSACLNETDVQDRRFLKEGSTPTTATITSTSPTSSGLVKLSLKEGYI